MSNIRQAKRPSHIPVQAGYLRNGPTSGTPRTNIASNCETFWRSACTPTKHSNHIIWYETKRPIASKHIVDQWKWEVIDAGNWGFKNQKNQRLKRSFCAYKVLYAIVICHLFKVHSKCMYSCPCYREQHTQSTSDNPTDDHTYGSPWCWLVSPQPSSMMPLCQYVQSKTHSGDRLSETWKCGFHQLSRATLLSMLATDTSLLANMHFKSAIFLLVQLLTQTIYSQKQWERSLSIQKTMRWSIMKPVRKERELSEFWDHQRTRERKMTKVLQTLQYRPQCYTGWPYCRSAAFISGNTAEREQKQNGHYIKGNNRVG